MKPGLTLDELQRIRLWRVAHRVDHPLEYHLWDVVLNVWVMGWTGIAPALVLGLTEWLPLCALALFSPSLYIGWRRRAHVRQRLRCDWLGPEA